MSPLHRLLRGAAGGALALTAAAPSVAATQSSKLSVPYTVDSLPNGLTVIVHVDHTVPVVTVNIWSHVGSGDEKPGRTGFAHLFKHLMFMGSQHAEYPKVDLQRDVVKPGRFETNAAIASQLVDLDSYGLPLSSINDFVSRVNAVTAADVQRVARQYIPADKATLVVVGDLAKVRAGIEALKLGTVTLLDASSIVR
jgi:predicted Zn-dependent peptidase